MNEHNYALKDIYNDKLVKKIYNLISTSKADEKKEITFLNQ